MSHNPYSPPNSQLEVELPSSEFRLGGRWQRLGAFFVDLLISGGVSATIMFATGDIGRIYALVSQGGRPDMPWKIKSAAIGIAVYCLINAYPLSQSGQSWGKRMLGLKIVDLQGGKPGLLRLLAVRYAVKQLVGLVPFVGGLAVVVNDLFIFRDDKRCIHDHIAGTRVVVAEST